MATKTPDENSASLTERAKRLILTPGAEWARIDAAPMTKAGIFSGWVIPLAAIGPIAALIGSLVFGYGAFGITYRPSIMSAVATALVSYGVALASIWIMALIINALAPNFGGTQNATQAMKVAAYSATAGWLAGMFQLMPSLGFLGLLGLYSLYLLYVGLPMLMKAPADKAMSYTIVTIVVAVVLFLVAGGITGAIASRAGSPFGSLGGRGPDGSLSGTLNIPGLGKVDAGKVEEASRRIEAAADRIKSGAADANGSIVPAASLQALLPAAIAGFARGDTESSSGAAGGIGGSRAEARYTLGEQSFTLSVTDTGALGSVATLGGALNIQSNKQTANGYEKTEMVDGRMTTEKWNGGSGSGSYGTMVGSRFMVSAEGEAPSIDTLKGAVAAVDLARLEALAK
ncbi:MAG: hypothetical protein B7Y45_00355 [Sphingomonas sp. 28-66-16]|nr:MAG: hypothetical protein B7Y45_00355 [Sphingomonas sp. 28-66-16]